MPFRILNEGQKFGRWQWISYDYVLPKEDRRRESQKVISSTLTTHSQLKPAERAAFLAPLLRASLKEADSKRESLTLVRPLSLQLEALAKSEQELKEETRKHKELADQLSFLEGDNPAEPLTPCKMQFVVRWKDQDGKSHRQECDDWETTAAFNRFSRDYGEKRAIEILKEKYEDQYLKAGLALGFSTHSRRNAENNTQNQWLLVGLIRLDHTDQMSLLL